MIYDIDSISKRNYRAWQRCNPIKYKYFSIDGMQFRISSGSSGGVPNIDLFYGYSLVDGKWNEDWREYIIFNDTHNILERLIFDPTVTLTDSLTLETVGGGLPELEIPTSAPISLKENNISTLNFI